MNVQTAIGQPRRVRLKADDFRLLRRSGAFAAYSRSELLDGELWGTVAEDSVNPIKLRIEDYLRLHEAGALTEYGKTELIDGAVYAMSPQHRRHMVAHSELAYRLRRALEAAGSTLFVGVEGSVALSEADLPLPDIVLTDEPRGTGPVPGSSVRLLVEIADTSLDHDLLRKARLFAARGVPEYWIADVNGRVIHQMWSPRDEDYAERREIAFGERLEAATVEGLAVETEGLD